MTRADEVAWTTCTRVSEKNVDHVTCVPKKINVFIRTGEYGYEMSREFTSGKQQSCLIGKAI